MSLAHQESVAQWALYDRMRQGLTLGEVVYDTHAHTCNGWNLGALYDGSAAGLLAEIKALGISGLAVSAVCAISGVDFKRANDLLEADLPHTGERFQAYVGVDIRHGATLVNEVQGYLRRGFSGGKLYTRWGVPYDDPRYHPVLELFAAEGMPILAHCWGGGDLTLLANAARKFPKANFIGAHTGSADLSVYMDLAKSVPNLYIDTAYSRGQRGLIEQVVQTMGSEKLLFGSDAALFSCAQQVARVVAARISDEDRRNILGRNALRIFPRWRAAAAAAR
jgi:uncharacterized protein